MPNRLTVETINKIKELRIIGFSIPEIALNLKISKTTALRYIQGVEIAPEYQHLWFGKRGGSRRRMQIQLNKARDEAQNTDIISNPRLAILASLYWAEGSKNDFNFINSDPQMIQTFVNLLRSELKVDDDSIRISIRIFGNMNEAKIRNFWSDLLVIPVYRFGNTEKVKSELPTKLTNGMCRVRVSKGGYLLKYLRAIREVMIMELLSPHSSTDRARVS